MRSATHGGRERRCRDRVLRNRTTARVVAVEPSWTMIEQRDRSTRALRPRCREALPFPDALRRRPRESHDPPLARLAPWASTRCRASRGGVVIFTYDPGDLDAFWLTADYFPEITEDYVVSRRSTSSAHTSGTSAPSSVRVPVPNDCIDGFLAAYWRRPERYLDRADQSRHVRLRDRSTRTTSIDRASQVWTTTCAREPGTNITAPARARRARHRLPAGDHEDDAQACAAAFSVFATIASTISGHARSGMSWPIPSHLDERAARDRLVRLAAVLRRHQRVVEPVQDEHRHRAGSRARSTRDGDAMIAAIWRRNPSG